VAEREAKLVITDARPEAVAAAIAALDHLAGRPLAPAGEVTIVDVYFDTAEGGLRTRGESLRVRTVDGRVFFTLKGSEREVGGGVIERDELEMPWSAEAHARLVEILGTEGIALRRAGAAGDPVDALLAAGLARIQERQTRRRLRYALSAGRSPIAELAIDAVSYRLAPGPVRHHEVEIEAKAAEGTAYLPRAVEELRGRFEGALTLWPHGKLATGFAIARLLASPEGGGLLAGGGRLAPAAYPRLAALLSAEDDAPAE
jgi:inorganic triphosphatase YgiF